MKTCPTSLRQNAYKVYKGENISDIEKSIVDKFFRYMEAYCAELKCSELDIFLNDKKWDEVYHLFERVMLKPEFA